MERGVRRPAQFGGGLKLTQDELLNASPSRGEQDLHVEGIVAEIRCGSDVYEALRARTKGPTK